MGHFQGWEGREPERGGRFARFVRSAATKEMSEERPWKKGGKGPGSGTMPGDNGRYDCLERKLGRRGIGAHENQGLGRRKGLRRETKGCSPPSVRVQYKKRGEVGDQSRRELKRRKGVTYFCGIIKGEHHAARHTIEGGEGKGYRSAAGLLSSPIWD